MNFSPAPVPIADTRSASSVLAITFEKASPSALRILPRKGSTACVLLSRPCLAEPPAESPSTMNSSVSSKFVDLQSASLPGRLSRRPPAVLRLTSLTASRDASRALADNTIRPTMASAAEVLLFSQVSRAGRTNDSTTAVSSGLLSRSLVCPWNIGSRTNTLRMPTIPSRTSSAVISSPLTLISWVAM